MFAPGPQVALAFRGRGWSMGEPLDPTPHSSLAHRLILDVAIRGRHLTPDELRGVLTHVAQAGFSPTARERARGSLAGLVWRGHVVQGRDLLPPLDRHYLRHVILQQEWPPGTTIEGYEQSIRDVILDRRSAAYVSYFAGAWQLGVLRQAWELRGPQGFDWLMVEYRLATGHWVTAYQPRDRPRFLGSRERTGVRWLRRLPPNE